MVGFALAFLGATFGAMMTTAVASAYAWYAWKNGVFEAKSPEELKDKMIEAARQMWEDDKQKRKEMWEGYKELYRRIFGKETSFNEVSPVGDFLVKLREAGARGEISPEREREIIAGLGYYLTKQGVKPEELEDYLKEEARKASGGEIDPKLEEQIEKASYVVQDYLDRERARTQAMAMR